MAVWFIPPPRLWWRDRQQHHGYTALASGITGDHLQHSAFWNGRRSLRRKWISAYRIGRSGALSMEVSARIGFILARARLTLIAFGLDLRHAPSGRNLRRYRYSYGCLVPGRPGKHQLFDCHRRPTDVRDYFGHSAERNSWSGLWPDDNRILELCLESGSGVAFGLHSVSLLRILCVPSALQRNFADALFAHQADLSRLHVHSRWRRAAVHLEWLRSACRTRCRSKQRANHRYPNNRGQLQLHDHGQRCGITTGSAECDLHYRYRDVINGGFTEKSLSNVPRTASSPQAYDLVFRDLPPVA